MLLRLYTMLWRILAAGVPLLLWRRVQRGKEFAHRRQERRGIASHPRPPDATRLYWLHAVSVGESIAAYVLARAILAEESQATLSPTKPHAPSPNKTQALSPTKPLTDSPATPQAQSHADSHRQVHADSHSQVHVDSHRQEAGVYVVMTTATTTAANMLARQIARDHLPIIQQMQPLDHPRWLDRFLSHWQPDVLVTLESDIWPMMVLRTHARHIPIAMMSAQISTRSFERWQWVGQTTRQKLFGCFSRIDAIDETHRKRFQYLLGDTNHRQHNQQSYPRPYLGISGPLKAAAPPLSVDADLANKIVKASAGRFIILLASCHAGEDVLVADAVISMQRDPSLLLILAPRYTDASTSTQLNANLGRRGYTAPLLSRGDLPAPDQPFWVADAMGIMGTLMSVADAVIMGGGFNPLGGHNPMEAAALKRGVISGRHIDKNRALYGRLDDYGGVVWASSVHEIATAIIDAMASPSRLARLNSAAFQAWQSMTHQAEAAAKHAISLTKSGGAMHAKHKSKIRGKQKK